VIAAGAFVAANCQTNITDVKIGRVVGTSLTITGGSMGVVNGKDAFWCSGAKHTWLGRLIYAGYTFDSDAARPLQFMPTAGGYLYLTGQGTVTYPNGTKVTFPR